MHWIVLESRFLASIHRTYYTKITGCHSADKTEQNRGEQNRREEKRTEQRRREQRRREQRRTEEEGRVRVGVGMLIIAMVMFF